MSRNREPVKPLESESESGEEDDEGSSEEDDSQESDSEPEQTPTSLQNKSAKPQQIISTPPPPPQKPLSSSEEEESGSETESESDEPDSNVRPLASKPIEEGQKSSNGVNKSRTKPNAPVPATPTKPIAAKRPAEGTSTPNSAKKTKTDDSETSEKKSNLFQRLWTEEDEIVLLKGMTDYTTKKNSDPIADLNGFHEFIKKNLHTDFTRAQLQDKIRRLKKKFGNNKGKEKEGKERTFSKPHEQKAYDLSKMIWGNESGKENGVVASPKANGSVARKTLNKKVNGTASEFKDAREVKDVKNAVVLGGEGGKSKKLESSSGGVSMEQTMLLTGREFYEAGLGIEGENEWNKLREEELKLYLKQLEVRAAQTKLVLDLMNREDH